MDRRDMRQSCLTELQDVRDRMEVRQDDVDHLARELLQHNELDDAFRKAQAYYDHLERRKVVSDIAQVLRSYREDLRGVRACEEGIRRALKREMITADNLRAYLLTDYMRSEPTDMMAVYRLNRKAIHRMPRAEKSKFLTAGWMLYSLAGKVAPTRSTTWQKLGKLLAPAKKVVKKVPVRKKKVKARQRKSASKKIAALTQSGSWS